MVVDRLWLFSHTLTLAAYRPIKIGPTGDLCCARADLMGSSKRGDSRLGYMLKKNQVSKSNQGVAVWTLLLLGIIEMDLWSEECAESPIVSNVHQW